MSVRSVSCAFALSLVACDSDSTLEPLAADGGMEAGVSAADGGVAGHWVTGYVVGYQREAYPLAEIEWSGLTHLAIGRLTPNADGSVGTTYDSDAIAGPLWAEQAVAAAHAHGKKAILMVGGEGEYSGWVGAASPAQRDLFVQNLLAVLDDTGADGLDLDWEPLNEPDEQPLAALITALREARPTLILTMPILWLNSNADEVRPIYAQIAPQLQQLNSMTYSMAGVWDGWVSWHSAALADATSEHPSSVESTMMALRNAGIPAAKLGFGVAFYGSCWSPPVTGPRQSTAGASVRASDNTMSYAHIMSDYYTPAAYQWDEAAQVPYLSVAAGRDCSFISYEDARSIAAKGAYLEQQGLGGLIIWTLGQGYVASAPASERNPLLKALAPFATAH